MNHVQEREAKLQAAKEELSLAKLIPTEETFPDGTLIRWKMENRDTHQVLYRYGYKTDAGQWRRFDGNTAAFTWENFVKTHLMVALPWGVTKLETVGSWCNMLGEEEPEEPSFAIADLGERASSYRWVMRGHDGKRWGYVESAGRWEQF